VLKNILGSGALARLLAQRLPNLGRSNFFASKGSFPGFCILLGIF